MEQTQEFYRHVLIAVGVKHWLDVHNKLTCIKKDEFQF